MFYREKGTLSKIKGRIIGKDTPWTGHIDIIRPDGSVETVNSSNQNCLFHAVIQATTNDPSDVQGKAVDLRSKVSEEVSSNKFTYKHTLKKQLKGGCSGSVGMSSSQIEGWARFPAKAFLPWAWVRTTILSKIVLQCDNAHLSPQALVSVTTDF